MEFAERDIIKRKDALFCIGRYLKCVPKAVRKEVLREMLKEKLLEKANSERLGFHNTGWDVLKIVNPEASESMAEFSKEPRDDAWVWKEMW